MLNLQETALLLSVFADSIKDGLDIKYILRRLKIAFEKKNKGEFIKQLQDKIFTSGSIAEGMSIFLPEHLVVAIRSGERQGNLDHVFEELKNMYETQIKVYQGFKKALSYPLFNLSLLFFMFTGALLFYIPKLKAIIKDIPQQKIPQATKTLIFLSDALKQHTILYFLIMIIIIIGIIFLFKKFKFLLFKIPLVQNVIIRQENIMSYILFSVFYISGVNLKKIFEILQGICQGPLKLVFEKANIAIMNGSSLSKAMELGGIDKEDVMYIEIGESTQRIEEAFKKLAQMEYEKLEKELNILLNASKNIMLILIGFFVIVFFGLTVLPIYDMLK